MPISVVFDPPLPSDSPSTFNTKAFTLLGDLNDWSTQANSLPGEVATNLTTLLAAPPAIGSTTPAAVSATTLSASGTAAIGGTLVGGSKLTVEGGRTYLQANNETYSLGVRYSRAAAGEYYIGATNSATPDLVMSNVAGTEKFRLSHAGAVTIPGSLSLTGGTLGYGTGAGGTVTQATSKSTAVTLNKPCGQITMNNAALAAGASIAFQCNCSNASATSTVVCNLTGSGYDEHIVWAIPIAGAVIFYVKNVSAVSQSVALTVNFAVISGATS